MKKITIVILTENTTFGDLDIIAREAESVSMIIEHVDKKGRAARKLAEPASLVDDVTTIRVPRHKAGKRASEIIKSGDKRIVWETVRNASGRSGRRINILESARRANLTLEQIQAPEANFPRGSIGRTLRYAIQRQEIMRKKGRATTPLHLAAE